MHKPFASTVLPLGASRPPCNQSLCETAMNPSQNATIPREGKEFEVSPIAPAFLSERCADYVHRDKPPHGAVVHHLPQYIIQATEGSTSPQPSVHVSISRHDISALRCADFTSDFEPPVPKYALDYRDLVDNSMISFADAGLHCRHTSPRMPTVWFTKLTPMASRWTPARQYQRRLCVGPAAHRLEVFVSWYVCGVMLGEMARVAVFFRFAMLRFAHCLLRRSVHTVGRLRAPHPPFLLRSKSIFVQDHHCAPHFPRWSWHSCVSHHWFALGSSRSQQPSGSSNHS